MTLPTALVEALADHLYADLVSSELGHCVRVDNLTAEDCLALWSIVHRRSADVAVHILADDTAEECGQIKAERAIELRNRKMVKFGLLVPSGMGPSGPSSLTNSFAPFNLDLVFATIAKDLLAQLPDDLRLAVMQVRHAVRGILAPSAEQWVIYVAAVRSQPTFVQAGAELWHVGLVPDAGGDSFVGRLDDNRRCTIGLTRPARAHSSPAERLDACRLEPGTVRRDLLAFLTRQGAQLRLGRGWLRQLAEPGGLGQLSFERWPLAEGKESDLRSIAVAPFVGLDGILAKGTKLHQKEPGAMPIAKFGPKEAVVVSWQPVPKSPAGVARWRAELIPSRGEISSDESGALELPSSKVRSTLRKTSVGLDLDPDVLPTTIMQVRVTALDEFGSEIVDETGQPVEALSQEFLLDSDANPDDGGDGHVNRQRTQSLPYGRLAAAVGMSVTDLEEDSVSWADGDPAEFGLRVGARGTLRIEFSPVLKQLQELVLARPGSAGAFQAETEVGIRIEPESLFNGVLPLPDAADGFVSRRRELFALLQSRRPRHLVEVAAWDTQLRRRARSYISAYRKALEAADPDVIGQLLMVDTLELRIAHRHGTHRAVLVLPTHPLRVAWMAVYDELLGGWAEKMLDVAPAERPTRVDLSMVARLAPLNIPAMARTSGGELFLFHQNLQFLTGLYVDPADRLPSRTAAAVAEAVGVKAGAVGAQVPPRVLAERIGLFRSCHPYVDALRLVAVNPGPGVLLADSLRDVFARPTDEEEPSGLPPRCEVVAFDESAAEPAPVPALRAWQDELYGQQPRGRHSFLTPLLTLTARPPAELRDGPPVSAHLAIVTDVGAPQIVLAERVSGGDSAGCFGLIARQLSAFTASEEGLEWRSQFRFGVPRTSGGPALVGELSETQQATVAALSRVIGGNPEHETVEIKTTLGPDDLSTIEALHASADWVVTVDRYLGLEAFDSPGDAHLGARSRKYVLDHAPDFLDGVGHRLSITTGHRAELELVLARAMAELGFGLVKESVGGVLDDIRTVSGRLALRVLGDDAHAREAVGLGVVVAYLRAAGQLNDTILVPVDAHPELFGPAARPALQGSRRARCDLIAVRFTARTLQMEFIEVKSRSVGANLESLYEQIADQCEATEDLVRDLFFKSDPARVDHVLQRARLAGILRHYLHHADRHGLIQSVETLAELADQLDRLESGFAELKSVRSGYVVTLDGQSQAKLERRGTTIRLLTAADLHASGFNSLHNMLSSGHPGESDAKRPGSPPPYADQGRERPQSDPDNSRHVGSGGADDTSGPGAFESAEEEASSEEGPEPSEDGGITVELGTIAGSGSALSWRISVTGSPHLFILGIPGQGKSVTVQRLLRAFAGQGLPVLVVDFHGQFGAGTEFQRLQVLDVADGLPFSPFEADAGKGATGWRTTAYAVAEIFQYLCDLGDIQRDVVYTALKRCYEDGGFTSELSGTIPTIGQFSDALEAAEAERKIKNVVPRCRPLLDFGLFRDEPATDLAELIRDGMVVDVHNVGLETVQQAAGAFVLRKVYRDMFRWGETDKLRLAIVLDEAHRLARDVTLPKLMKEGRKFGIVVVVASQGLDDFHRDVVGNAGTKVVFRTNFPQSKRVAQFLRGRAGTDIAAVIEQLSVGEAVVSMPALDVARRVLMYPLETP